MGDSDGTVLQGLLLLFTVALAGIVPVVIVSNTVVQEQEIRSDNMVNIFGTPYSGLGGDIFKNYGVFTPDGTSADVWVNDTYTYEGETKSWVEWAGEFEGWRTTRLGFKFSATESPGNTHSVWSYPAGDDVLDYFDSYALPPILANFEYGWNGVAWSTYWDTEEFLDHWKEMATYYLADSRVAAFEIYNEMYVDQLNGHDEDYWTDRMADITQAIHAIDANRVVIYPEGQHLFDNATDFITSIKKTDLFTAGNLTETNVVFDAVHPYYWECDYDPVEGDPVASASWYRTNWLDPIIAVGGVGAAKVYMGETFAWESHSVNPYEVPYTPYIQAQWLEAWIRECNDAGISFCMWNGLGTASEMDIQIPVIQAVRDVYPSGTPPVPVGLTLPWNDQLDVITDWTKNRGTWNVAANVLTGSGDEVSLISVGEGEWTNVSVQATAEITAASTVHEAALVARFADTQNYYWAGVGCYQHEFAIGKMVGGVHSEIASSGVIASVAHATPYTLKFVAEDTTLELWVGGVKKLEVVDAALTSGAVGLRGWYSEVEYTAPTAVDPAISTFGDTTLEAGASAIATAGICYIEGAVFTLGEAAYATSISVALSRAVAGTDNVKCAIYLHSDLSLVEETPARSITFTTVPKWFNFPFTTPVLLAAVAYIPVCEAEYTAQNISMYKVAGDVNQEHYQDLVAYGAFTDPLVPVSANFEYSIYCNYTPTAAPGTVSLMVAAAVNNRRR